MHTCYICKHKITGEPVYDSRGAAHRFCSYNRIQKIRFYQKKHKSERKAR